MRVKKAIMNIVVGGVGTLFSGVLLFVSRIIFVQFLSDEYLGISSLLTNILSILSMAELGIGTAIGFSLYEPLVEKDTEKIKSIMHFLKHIYFVIGFVIIAAGMILFFNEFKFIKDSSESIKIPYLPFAASNPCCFANSGNFLVLCIIAA